MSELLIPFGIHRTTGKVIEPEDAPKGRACNCLCPGCKAPLLSRHPKEYRYHFAHDSRHEEAKPETECPFNSAVAVAMMIREIASELAGEILVTPPYIEWETFACCNRRELLDISNMSTNRIDNAETNTTTFEHHTDLKLTIGTSMILIDLVYNGKPRIAIDENILKNHKIGILELDCDSFGISKFKRNRNLRFSEAVKSFVLEDGMKTWRYHPRTAIVRAKALHDHHCTPRRRSKPVEPYTPLRKRVYYCVHCGYESPYSHTDGLKCPKCNNQWFTKELD